MKKVSWQISVSLPVVLFFIGLFLAAVGGWVANIVKIFGTSFDPLTEIAVLRVVGIFIPPLGSAMGYI